MMKHVFYKGTSDRTLVLLHGTGGNEHDLIDLGRFIDPEANLLGIRGNVLEHGMSRFFKRISFGVFDEKNLLEETDNLNHFMEEAIIKYQLNPKKINAIGYSNGANILISWLFKYADIIQHAMCLHAMVPIRDIELAKHHNTHVLLTAGKEDHMVNVSEMAELKHMLETAQIHVDLFETPYGHQITKMELDYIKTWYDELKK